jgi:hypothetical protein
MNGINQFLSSIPLDKYLHLIGSVVIFAALHGLVGLWPAAGIAAGSHVLKKFLDYCMGRRDLDDMTTDILAGLAGVALAVGCAL